VTGGSAGRHAARPSAPGRRKAGARRATRDRHPRRRWLLGLVAVVVTAVAVPLGAGLDDDPVGGAGGGSAAPVTTTEPLRTDPSALTLGPELAARVAAQPPPRKPPIAPERRAAADLVPADGPGVFRIAADLDPDASTDGATTYTVEVEESLPFDVRRVAAIVADTLDDERGWRGVLGVELEQVGPDDDPDLRVRVATPGTTDELCYPLLTRGQVSCRNGDLVLLNALRWTVGIPDYDGRLALYRTYLVNHEVGHALGRSHVSCPGPGEPAPVMMQQTYGLGECRRNAWPVDD
jgi:hypothetical protein